PGPTSPTGSCCPTPRGGNLSEWPGASSSSVIPPAVPAVVVAVPVVIRVAAAASPTVAVVPVAISESLLPSGLHPALGRLDQRHEDVFQRLLLLHHVRDPQPLVPKQVQGRVDRLAVREGDLPPVAHGPHTVSHLPQFGLREVVPVALRHAENEHPLLLG